MGWVGRTKRKKEGRKEGKEEREIIKGDMEEGGREGRAKDATKESLDKGRKEGWKNEV